MTARTKFSPGPLCSHVEKVYCLGIELEKFKNQTSFPKKISTLKKALIKLKTKLIKSREK